MLSNFCYPAVIFCAVTLPLECFAQTGPDLSAVVTVNANSYVRDIPRTLFGTNIEWIYAGYGIWDLATDALQTDIVRLAGGLSLSLVRFPSAADSYHWQDGIGPRAMRPVRMASPTGPLSAETFGTDEALSFASAAGAELMITVNVETGTPEEAAGWVQYVNGGGRRVTYWEIGNEPYLTWSGAPMAPSDYAQKVVQFSTAMRAADPGIKIGAVGGENYGQYNNVVPGWNQTLLQTAGQYIDFLAVHNSYTPVLLQPDPPDVRTVYESMLAAPQSIRGNLETLTQQIATYVPDRASQIRLAITEFGPLFQTAPSSSYVDHVKTLGSALYVASVMNAFIQSPQVDIANFFKLVDNSFMGWIGMDNGAYLVKAPYMVMQMYSQYVDQTLVSTTVNSPTFTTPPLGVVDQVTNAPYLEVIATASADRKKLTLLAVNKNFDSAVEASFTLQNFMPDPAATVWTLTGTAPDANTGTQLFQAPGIVWAPQAVYSPNGRFNQGNPSEVSIQQSTLTGVSSHLVYRFPAHSVTALILTSPKTKSRDRVLAPQ